MRRPLLAGLCVLLVVGAGVGVNAPAALAGPADGVLALTAERAFDGVAPLPSIDDDPALPTPPGYLPGAGENHNGEVATFDRVGYRFTVSYNLAPGAITTSERVRNVTLTMTATAGARWRMPNGAPPSGCSSATGAGSNVLTCVVNGPVQTGDAFAIPAELYAPATFAEGAVLNVSGSVRAEYLTGGTTPSGTFVGPVIDTAASTTIRTATYAPNLRKYTRPQSAINRDPATGAPTSVDISWPFDLEPDARSGPGVASVKGYGGLPGDRATFTDRLSAATPAGIMANATVSGCGTRGTPTGAAAPFYTYANGTNVAVNLANSGTWTCSQASAGADVTMTVTNADYAARWFPSGRDVNDIAEVAGFSQTSWDVYDSPAGQNIRVPVAQGYVATRIPWADLVAADAAETGGNRNNQILQICNTAAGDLTLSTTAAPATPLAVEPASRTGDNRACQNIDWRGSYSNQSGYIGDYSPGGGTATIGANALNGGPGASVAGQTVETDQDAVAGDHLFLQAVASRSGTSVTPVSGHVTCQAFDGDLFELSPSDPRPAVPTRHDGTWYSVMEDGARPAAAPPRNLAAEWTVEFASVASWRTLPSRFARVTDVDSDGDGTVDCADPDVTNWTTDPSTLTTAPNLVRIQAAGGAQIHPGTSVAWTIPVRVRPDAPDDAIAIQATRSRASNLALNGSTLDSWDRPCTGERTCAFTFDGYDTGPAPTGLPYPAPTTGTNGFPSYSFTALQVQRNSSNWDRLRVVPARARVRTTDRGPLPSDYPSAALPEDVRSLPAGNLWTAYLAVDLTTGPRATTVRDIRFIDVFPSSVLWTDGSVSPSRQVVDCDGIVNPGCLTDPALRTNTGKTTAVFDYGDIAIPAAGTTTAWIRADYLTPLAANGTLLQHTVAVSGSGMQSSWVRDAENGGVDQFYANDVQVVDRDEDRATLTSTPLVQLRKAVLDPLVPSASPYRHVIRYANTTASTVPTLDVVDVLPENGVYAPASSFAGTNRVGSIQANSTHLDQTYVSGHDFDGTASTGVGASQVLGDLDPAHPSNTGPNAPGTAGGNWACTFDQVGDPGCPATLDDVTGIRWVMTNVPTGGAGSFELTFDPAGNQPNDVYSNRAGARAVGTTLPLFTDVITTRVFGGSLGDLVYEDVDGDGRFTAATDRPLPDVTVELWDDATDTRITTTTTDARGRWVFNRLDQGRYRVRIPAAEFIGSGDAFGLIAPAQNGAADVADGNEQDDHDGAGFLGTGDYRSASVLIGMEPNPAGGYLVFGPLNDGPTDGSPSLATAGLPDNHSWMTLDLGLVRAASLSGTVNGDRDDDGTYDLDAGDTALSGVTVRLSGTDAGGDPVSLSTVTDDEGFYRFLDLAPGDYRIDEDQTTVPAPYLDGRSRVGSLGSGADAAGTARPAPQSTFDGVRLRAGDRGTDYDFFETFPFYAVGNRVWSDVDGDGRYDAGTDDPVAGVTVEVLHVGGANDGDVAGADVTDASGVWHVEGLAAGNYRVRIPATAFVPGGPLAGWTSEPTGSAADPDGGGDDVGAGADHDARDAASGPAVGGVVTGVLTLSGNDEPTGEAAAGVALTDPGIPDTRTDFTLDLALRPPSGLAVSALVCGLADTSSCTAGDDADWADSHEVFAGDPVRWRVTVTNTGGQDLADVQVTAAVEPGCDTVIGALPRGATRTVACDTASLTADTTLQAVATARRPGDPAASLSVPDDARALVADGAVGDRVWYDVDGDGAVDAGEPGLGGATVTVRWLGDSGDPGDDRLFTDVTGSDGSYQVGGLRDGAYTVSLTALDPDLTPTSDLDSTSGTGDRTAALTLIGGTARTDIDFGETVRYELGGTAWVDRDGDGRYVPAADDTVAVGTTVRVYDDTGVLRATTATGAEGSYLVTLPTGRYRVVVPGADLRGLVVAPGGAGDPDDDVDDGIRHDAVTSGPGTPGDLGGADAVTGLLSLAHMLRTTSGDQLAGGEPTAGIRNTTLDLAFRYTNGLGDRVWYDRDRDGQQDPAEPGIAGVTARLDPGTPTNPADDRTDVTGAAGGYFFDAAPPGTYTVSLDTGSLDPDLRATHDASGDAGTQPGPRTDRSATVVVAAGDQPRGVDFGETIDVELGGSVWLDHDGDGRYDAGEPDVPDGTAVQLRDSSGVIVTTTGTVAGQVLFTGLPAGDYWFGIQRDALTGILTGAVAAPGGAADPDDDAGRGVRHDAVDVSSGVSAGGVRTGLVTLGATFGGAPGAQVSGGEPLGGGYVNDTLDIGLLGAAALTVRTEVCDPASGLCDPDAALGAGGWVESYQASFGDEVTWRVAVTNTGQQRLTGVTLVAPTAAGCARSPLAATLDVGQTGSITCVSTGVVTPVTNAVTATGNGPTGDRPSSADDAAVTLPPAVRGLIVQSLVLVDGVESDADAAPGVAVAVGDPVTWVYAVSLVPGATVPVRDVTLTDDGGGSGATFAPRYLSGDTDGDDVLDPGETWRFEAPSPVDVTPGLYVGTATAAGTPIDGGSPAGSVVTGADPAHHRGVDARVDVELAVDGQDADTGPGAALVVDPDPGAATWTYRVSNPGNVPLAAVAVTQDRGAELACGAGDDADGTGNIALLAAGATVTCSAT
ncbi:MAG: SdrD B-like domain-containing protein, partial [Phycicoccus sp.]